MFPALALDVGWLRDEPIKLSRSGGERARSDALLCRPGDLDLDLGLLVSEEVGTGGLDLLPPPSGTVSLSLEENVRLRPRS